MDNEKVVIAGLSLGTGLAVGSISMAVFIRRRLRKIAPLVEKTVADVIVAAVEKNMTHEELMEYINDQLKFFQIAVNET